MIWPKAAADWYARPLWLDCLGVYSEVLVITRSRRRPPDRPMPAVSQAQEIGNTVSNSIVSNPAVEFHGSMGISVGYTIATNLSHNDVGNCTYGPISVGW